MDTTTARRRLRGTALIAVGYLVGLALLVTGAVAAVGRGDAALNGASLAGLAVMALVSIGIIRLARVAK